MPGDRRRWLMRSGRCSKTGGHCRCHHRSGRRCCDGGCGARWWPGRGGRCGCRCLGRCWCHDGCCCCSSSGGCNCSCSCCCSNGHRRSFGNYCTRCCCQCSRRRSGNSSHFNGSRRRCRLLRGLVHLCVTLGCCCTARCLGAVAWRSCSAAALAAAVFRKAIQMCLHVPNAASIAAA